MKKKAQSIMEYAIIMAFVALISIYILEKLSNPISNVGNRTNSAVNNSDMNTYCKSINCSGYDNVTSQCLSCPN